ncbi:protein serine phosphatase with GAF(s) sensor(s) [Thermaerobacter marianensis DSM 12885]|uniref:Protein serine phosphatase with GAF(S) sensor(S) n=1 Tax=Thermaerobacter marianensis (strain ATCC 700841 / DSM 12885 / JCM 10246 / 7p75a) TaxID=644966 RepID=E6SI32_THEM7|nr:SpoIIE family protein phosphatase [Thermaerobacter marianensis]ADU50810.1 protein serine phosphatase with GAF(s) sensor(s) [Thermaerobacter marianensis DSM 12885]
MGDPRNRLGTPEALRQAERSAHFAAFRRLIDRGIAALEARDALAAIEHFTAAYDLAVAWRFGDDVVYGTLLNLSIARRLAGDYEGALHALERALALDDLTVAQRAALWNEMGVFHSERGNYRKAAFCGIRAYRLAAGSASDPNLCAEVAGNVVDSYLHLGAPEQAVRWAARAAWHARRATPWRRQHVAVQTVAACLATGRLRLAERILRRLEMESLDPDFISQFLRLRAEWWFRTGDRRQALAWAARALDAAVRDMSPEDVEDACRALERFGGQCPNPHWERHLLDALRSHQELIGAFARACTDLDLGGEPQMALVLAGRDGRILLRAGGNQVLDRLAEQGYVAGAVVAEAEWDAKFARAAVASFRNRSHAPNPDRAIERDIEGYVLVWPPLPTLAQAIATLTARMHADENAARLQADNQQALAKLSAFHDAALALGGPLETGEVVTRLLALTQQLSHSDGVALLFTDPARGTWAEGLDGEALRRSRAFQTTAEKGRPQRLIRDDPRARDDLQQLGVASLIAVPVYFGGTECGAVLAAARLAGAPFSEEDLELVSFISKQFGLALENAALRDDLSRRLEALTRDLRIARRLQQAFMPGGVIREDGVVLTGMSVPAKYVGGDVYDITHFPDGSWRVAVGDVMGKGVGAAMLGSILLVRLRETWAREPFGPDLVRHLDEIVAPDLRRGRALATLLLALYCPRNRQLRVLTAGHDGPVLWRGGSWHPVTRGGGTALGLLPGYGTVAEATLPVQPGDVVLFYSDGFAEILLDRRGVSASREVADALLRHGLKPSAGDAQALLDQIRGLTENGDHPDDVTVVVLGVRSQSGGGIDAT